MAPPREEPTHFPELKCEKSDAYFVLRDGASGVFMSAHNFPKSRETRAPKVAELAQYRDRLPENYNILPMRLSKIRKGMKRLSALAVKKNVNM
ncbi:DNA topoisomerase I [Actinobacillus equuli]|nr:DNA topoisomerase I [Actinobacillus equuli]